MAGSEIYRYYSGEPLTDESGYLYHHNAVNLLRDLLKENAREEWKLYIEASVSEGQVDVLLRAGDGTSVAFEVKTMRESVERGRNEWQMNRYEESCDDLVWVLQKPSEGFETAGVPYNWYYETGRPVYLLDPENKSVCLAQSGGGSTEVADILPDELHPHMTRKLRVNYSIPADVLDAFEEQVPHGERSAKVSELLREEYVDE